MDTMSPAVSRSVSTVGSMSPIAKRVDDILSWLTTRVGLPQYATMFRANGYDSMKFILLMHGPSDLYEVGVVNEAHVQRLWSEICRLKEREKVQIRKDVTPQTPQTPMSPVDESDAVRRWLTESVGLPQYANAFCLAGYDDLRFVVAMQSVSEVIALGVTENDHVLRLWDAITKLKYECVVEMESPRVSVVQRIPSRSPSCCQSPSPTASYDMV